MKNALLASLVTLVAASFLIPAGSAEATMYVDTEERRNTLLGTFVLISGMVGGLCTVFALITRDSGSIEESAEPSSVVVPPTKQESNIVPHLITA
jgi:hypothetical protein